MADQTSLVLFCGPTYNDRRVYAYNQLDLLMQDPAFDATRATALYAHGYHQNLSAPAFQALVAAYLAKGEHNLVAYDWSLAVDGDFLTSALPNTVNVRFIATGDRELNRNFSEKSEYSEISAKKKCIYYIFQYRSGI